MTNTPSESTPLHDVKVWDILVRIFHWALALGVLLNLFVFEEGETLHQYSGYIVCGLVMARILWGFVGTHYARFSEFFPTVEKVRHQMLGMAQGDIHVHVGHSPMGAVVMMAMGLAVLGLAFTGFLMDTDQFFGSELLEEVHELIANGLMSLVFVHVLAAVVLGKIERVNLVSAMVTGVKRFQKPVNGHK